MSEKYLLSSRQIICLITLFLFGSSVVVGVNINTDVGQDSWLSLVFSFIFSIPFVLMISRIITLFPGKNIFEIFDELLGKKAGNVFTLLFVIHTIYIGAIVLRNFSEYVEVSTLSETPQIPIMICLMLIVFYLTKSGIKTLGRWAPIILMIIIITMSFTLLLSIPIADVENLKPMLDHSFTQMATSAFNIFMLPFSELTVFLGFGDCLNLKKNVKKTYLIGIAVTGIILLLILIRNILVLGIPLLKMTFFSSYEAARILEIGEFFTRIEGVITINFILAGLTKIAVFLIVVSKGIAHLTKNNDYKNIAMPSSLLMLAICPFIFDNVLDMFEFAPIFGKYAFIFQVALPILILIIAEYKKIEKNI